MDKYAKIITGNMYEFLTQFGKINGGNCENLDGYRLIYAGITRLNSVINININIKNDHLVKNVIKKFKEKNYSFIWILEDKLDSNDIKKLLLDNGFILRDSITGKLLNLNDFNIQYISNDNILVKKVHNDHELSAWLKIVKVIYNITDKDYPRFQNIINQIIDLNNGNMELYTAYYNLKPVTTAAIFKGSNSIGIYWVATVESERCKGFATHLMQYILNVLKKKKYENVVLQSSDIACNLYKKIHFKRYCEYKIYSYDN